MNDFLFSIPLLFILLISPFLSSLRILQFFIAFVAIAHPYFAGFVMLLLTPLIYYKSFINKKLIFSNNLRKFLFFYLFWIISSIITIFWVPDLKRFFTEIVQLILILSLSFVFIYEIKEKKDIIKTNTYIVLCGLLVALKSFFDSFNEEFVPVNYYAFILVVTCVVIPLSFQSQKRKSRLYSFFLLVVAFIGININESRGSLLLGILVILIRIFLLNDLGPTFRKYLILIFFFITPLGAFLFYNLTEENLLKSVLDVERNYSNLERLALLNQSINIFVNNLKGIGYGSTNLIFMSSTSLTDGSYPHPHNTLAHIAVELGLLGILIYFYIFYFSFVSVYKNFQSKNFSIENNQIYKVALMLFLVLFLFSFLDDMLFNGMFSFYCLLFFAYSYSLSNLYQQRIQIK